MAIIRNEPLHKQVAAAMRKSIADGAWPPGSQLPTETDLAETYGVSRPTVRLAVSALRAEGLLDVKQGRGTFVRTTVLGPATIVERTITQRGPRFETPVDLWLSDEEPAIYRTRTDATTGPVLDMAEGELMIGADRLLTDSASGTRALHRLLLPMERIEGTPLAETPDASPAKAYTILATAGHDLTWRDQISARVPQPDEREALKLSEGAALLVVQRVTIDRTTGQPLMLEETRLGAETAALGYPIDAHKAPARSAKTTR